MVERERFSYNSAFDEDIHEIIDAFPEPSRTRMRKKIRQDQEVLLRSPNENTDSNARHTFREFLVAYQLQQHGLSLEYGKSISGQTPDWIDEKRKLLLEVFTCERGGCSDPILRTANSIAEKTLKYKAIVEAGALHFVLGIHGDFLSGLNDRFDCEDALAQSGICEGGVLSGIVFFTETNVELLPLPTGQVRKKQRYSFDFIPNEKATRPLDLTLLLS
jgi:hypothetical protein